MTEREALLHAICLEPYEDTPRLAYADWLDEYGDEDDKANAEQIRVQIENPDARIELPWKHPAIPGITGSVSRGFVAEIELRMQQYLDNAKELFLSHPITIVHISDKFPFNLPPSAYSWNFAIPRIGWDAEHMHPGVLPLAFHEPMTEHPLSITPDFLQFASYSEAQLAASEVAVNLVRKLIDLPPLPLTKRLRPKNEPA